MRRIVLLAGVLLVVPALGSDAPKEYDGRAVTDDLEGAWQLIREELPGWSKTIEDGPVAMYRNGTQTVTLKGRLLARRPFTVDAVSRPARMTCVETAGEYKGETWRHIYQIEGDTLRMIGPLGGEWPTTFEDPHRVVDIYKRVKK
jgi:uncharacterized protein (TIGR03067 family)